MYVECEYCTLCKPRHLSGGHVIQECRLEGPSAQIGENAGEAIWPVIDGPWGCDDGEPTFTLREAFEALRGQRGPMPLTGVMSATRRVELVAEAMRQRLKGELTHLNVDEFRHSILHLCTDGKEGEDCGLLDGLIDGLEEGA